jgi:hypothetical protein
MKQSKKIGIGVWNYVCNVEARNIDKFCSQAFLGELLWDSADVHATQTVLAAIQQSVAT